MYVVYVVVALVGVQIAFAGYCHRPDLDCGGNDIRSLTADETACKTACDGDANCKSIQVYKGTCWLKRKACQNHELRPLVLANDFVKYDGRCGQSDYAKPSNKYCLRDQTDCGGHDIIHVTGTSGRKQCQTLCDFQKDCLSIQILEDGQCWLKRHACTNSELRPWNGGNDYVKIARDAKCTEYKIPRQKYCHRAGMDCPGHDIHHLNWVKTAKECQQLCNWNKDCESIQYHDNDCWLKRHVCSNSELRALPDYNDYVKVPADTSCDEYKIGFAYRYCERPEKDCAGNDILSTSAATVDYCQDLCSYKDECKSIQYIEPTCWLKRHVCDDSELRDWQGGRDHVKIPRASNCRAELAKLV